MTMRVETYGRYTQQNLRLDDEEWTTLREYVETIESALREEATAIGGVEEIEEDPPAIDGETFRPGGWVGLYPGNVTVVPRHLAAEEYQVLLEETQRWVEILGATTIKTSLPLSTDILIDARTQLAAYSETVIGLSETVRTQRLPVDVQRTQYRGPESAGRPLFAETMREAARGTRQVVSEDLRFSFDTLLNYLLVRFHVELLTEMSDLADRYPYYESAFSAQIDYHEEFVTTDIPSRFVDKAVQADFSSPSVIAQARREATDEMAEIIDLWEAFQRDIGMELTVSNRLNTAVKPISKLYELWCLGTLLELLADLTGRQPENPETIHRMYRFGDGLRLHYNRSLGRFSRYFKDNLGLPRGPGQPDFALEYGEQIIWVGDAKFKTSVKRPDYQRFLTYVVDLLPSERVSTIFYVAPNPLGRASVRDYPIEHLSLRPETVEQARTALSATLQQILRDANAA